TEAIVTGTLAGYNAVRHVIGLKCIELPSSLAVGDIIKFENESKKKKDGLRKRYTFAGAEYFERMKSLNLYTVDVDEIKRRVRKLLLNDMFKEKLI
ncbi:MAG: FAD-dependent oxidoreductase, partial [Caloramator sp.]|nr:FAD-dependent oxidoreductase [Caloramator sp.]